MSKTQLHCLLFALIIGACLVAPLSAGELFDQFRKEHGLPSQRATNAARDFERLMGEEKEIIAIGLERTPCFGRCPAYTVIIQSYGTLRYEGKADVPRLGKHTGRVDEWQLTQLFHFAKDINFAKFDAAYHLPVTDMPSVYSMVETKQGRKIVRNYANVGPATLWAFEQLIDKLLLEAKWDAAGENPPPKPNDDKPEL